MAAIPYDVAEAFLNHKTARRGEFVSYGVRIRSYTMLLAEHMPDGCIRFNYQRLDQGGRAPSATTARHMRALEAVVSVERCCADTHTQAA